MNIGGFFFIYWEKLKNEITMFSCVEECNFFFLLMLLELAQKTGNLSACIAAIHTTRDDDHFIYFHFKSTYLCKWWNRKQVLFLLNFCNMLTSFEIHLGNTIIPPTNLLVVLLCSKCDENAIPFKNIVTIQFDTCLVDTCILPK